MAMPGRCARVVAGTVVAAGLAVAAAGCDASGSAGGVTPGTQVQSPPAGWPGTRLATVDFDAPSAMGFDTVDHERSIIDQRIASANLTDVTAHVDADGVRISGPSREERQFEMAGLTGDLGFRPVLATSDVNAAAGSEPPGVSAEAWQQYVTLDCPGQPVFYEPAQTQIAVCHGFQRYLLGVTGIVATSVTSAGVFPDGSTFWQVSAFLNSEGATELERGTSRLAGTGTSVAVTVDGVVYATFTVKAPITGGNLPISSGFDLSTAQTLDAVLQSGTLRASLQETKVVLPTD